MERMDRAVVRVKPRQMQAEECHRSSSDVAQHEKEGRRLAEDLIEEQAKTGQHRRTLRNTSVGSP